MNYFKGTREQALNCRELGTTVKNAYDLAFRPQPPRLKKSLAILFLVQREINQGTIGPVSLT